MGNKELADIDWNKIVLCLIPSELLNVILKGEGLYEECLQTNIGNTFSKSNFLI